MEGRIGAQLESILSRPPDDRVFPLAVYAGALADARERGDAPAPAVADRVNAAILALFESGAGSGSDRMALGEALGRLGDPRLRRPSDPEYWASVEVDGAVVQVGRFPVTCFEYQRFVTEGGYQEDPWWSDAGRAWRDGGGELWPTLALDPEVQSMVIPNQPVVGVTWFEAEAYARSQGARLLTQRERRALVRGGEKRPYPWGAPFGQGNANTREEVLSKPCAVGIFPADRTPDGIYDLAGNAAEWNQDQLGDMRLIHPGSWMQPSMAAWAKAVAMFPPDHRSPDLGLRLARG
jgi:formylglycine-generating enzyme required for sulfatase activity